MVRTLRPPPRKTQARKNESRGLDAEIIIANAPDPVFVADLEGKILQANDAVSELLGFRPDELLEQSLSRFIGPEELREFTAALREVVERGVTRNALLHPRSASGEVIPTTLNASALRDPAGQVIGRSASCGTCAGTRRSSATWKNPRPSCKRRSSTWKSSKRSLLDASSR